MANERLILETISRCVSTMVFFHNSERTREVNAWMVDEVRAIAGMVQAWELPGDEADRRLLRPVRDELVARYGHELGPRLAGRFNDVFEGVAMPRYAATA